MIGIDIEKKLSDARRTLGITDKGRKDSDESYVIDLCDEVLGESALRQHTFDFLRGDPYAASPYGKKLPVDAYYPSKNIVVEYREKQHSEAVPLFDNKATVSGVSRGEQRKRYDQRRREVLPQYGIKLVEIPYSSFKVDSRKKIIRNKREDIDVVRNILSEYI